MDIINAAGMDETYSTHVDDTDDDTDDDAKDATDDDTDDGGCGNRRPRLGGTEFIDFVFVTKQAPVAPNSTSIGVI